MYGFGDLNGDGHDDVLLTANGAGKVYLFSFAGLGGGG